MTVAPTLVVGGGGLLGQNVVRALRRRGTVVVPSVTWAEPEAALTELIEAAATTSGAGPWRLAWCAGAGIVATPAAQLEAEVDLFRRFLAALNDPPEAIFFASSAGGVYAGSPDRPPYTETSVPQALVAYGHAKLAMEQAVTGYAATYGSRAVLGRIANLYGPGQNLHKPQGLVSQLCRTQLTGEPLGIYVPFDTLRDYLYAEDAGTMVRACLDRAAKTEPGTTTTKILASGRAVSIAALVAESTRVARRRPRLSTRATPASAAQIPDLRLRSTVWPEIDALARTPLLVGLHDTADDIAAQQGAGQRAVSQR